MKKLLLLLVIILLPMVASADKSGTCGDNLTWTLVESTGTLTISGSGEMENYNDDSSAPWYSYKGDIFNVVIKEGVTSIGSHAFFRCSGLTSITIPNSVTSIGSSAFNSCSGLTSITIPNSVTSIEYAAFSSCSGLTSITIPNSVTSIEYAAFGFCSGLTSVKVEAGNTKYDSRDNCNAIIETATNTLIRGTKNTIIPNSVTSIFNYAFSGCSGLTSVTIPNSVTSIGDYAFNGCSGLTSITIPNSVTSIGYYAFEYCSGLTSLKVEAGNTKYDSRDNCNAIIETATNTLIRGAKNTIIPNSVTSIGYNAFQKCSGLTSVTIPNSVTSIFNYAFSGCSGLTSVTIPNSVTSIGYEAFSQCSSLTSVTIPNSVTSIGSKAFSFCSGLTSVTVEAKTPLKIENGVFESGYNATLYVPTGSKAAYEAANYWKKFKEIKEFVTPSDMFVFTANSDGTTCSLTGYTDYCVGDVTIPESWEGLTVTSIGSSAFNCCSGLTSITIPNSVISIGDGAFILCSGLTSITIPNSVTSIGNRAFDDCSGLTSLKVEAGNTKYDSRDNCNAIIETATNTLIRGTKNTIIPNSVTSIGYNAFQKCSGLTSVTIPNSVTSIGNYAFSECSSLTSVTVEVENPITISQDVFSNRANATLYVPAGSKASYEAADYWKDFKNIITFGSEVIANNLTRDYGEANPELTYTVNGDEISGMPVLTCEATETSPVGTYDILISKGTVSSSNVSYKKGILTINLRVVSSPTIILSQSSYIYDGTAKEPTVTVKDGETIIPADEYTVSYSDNTNAGTATVTITDKEAGNYIVSGSTTFMINAKTVSDPTVILSEDSYTYDGNAKEPTVTVKDGETIIPDDEYTVSYSDNTNVGTATVTITDKDDGNYIVSGSTTFTINTKTVSDPTVTLSETCYTYDGTAKEPTVTVKDGETIIPADEYIVSYVDNTNAGTATVTITDKEGGNYNVSGSTTFTINVKTVSNPTITLSEDSYTYDGTAKEPIVTVKDGETIIPDDEYTVSYSDNTNVGTATVTITDKDDGNYIVSGSTTFTINTKTVSDPTVTFNESSCIYDGTAKEPTLTVKDGETIIPAEEYTVSYSDNTNAGTATVTITDKEEGNYIVSGSTTFTIAPKTVSAPTISLSPSSYTYDGNAKEPTVIVKDGETIVPAEEYKVSYSDNTNAGTATVTITDKEGGNYNVSGSTTFIINSKTVSVPTISLSQTIYFFDGEVKIPTVRVNDGETVIPASEYTVSYYNNTNAGTATVIIIDNEGGNYFVGGSTSFTIYAKTVNNPTIILSTTSYICDGTAKEPTVTVMDDETVIPASEYTISYSNNTNVGTATVTIIDKEGGNYIVSGSTTFTIHGMELPADELFSGSNLWAGYVAQEDLRPGTGLKVYAITKLGTTTATASQIDYMPQGVPVLLKRADTTVSSYEVTLGTGTAPTTNLLRVFNTGRSVSNREGFILYNDEFVLVNEGVLPAGRVFLPANNLQLSRGMTRSIVIDDDDATGIEDLEESPAEEEPYDVYDLSGRKVANQVTSLDGLPHGIYIVNGKKMLKR